MLDQEVRRTGIGASEIAAVCGLDPYKSRWQVYAEKKGLIEQRETLAMRRGRQMERAVAQVYSEEYKRQIRWLGATVRSPHPRKPWQLATPDFCHIDEAFEDVGGEVKYPRWLKEEVWGEDGTDEVPENYVCQTNWQAAVMGWSGVMLTAMFGGQELRVYPIPRDDELITAMEHEAGKFWRNHVEKDVPPELDASDEARRYLLERFPRAELEFREATKKEIELVIKYQKISDVCSTAEKDKKLYRNMLLDAVGPARGLIGPGWRLTCSEVKGSEYTVKREPGRAIRISEEKREEKDGGIRAASGVGVR